MASQTRDYEPEVAYGITVRFSVGLPLLEHPELEDLFSLLSARYQVRCKVDELGYSMQSNHVHLTLIQHLETDQDPDRIEGIGPFMRNLLSQFILHVKRIHNIDGLRVSEVYAHVKREANIEVAANLIYTDANISRHLRKDPSEARTSSFRTHDTREPDGLVTVFLAWMLTLHVTWGTLVRRVARRAMALQAKGVPSAWRTATREVLLQLGFTESILAARAEYVPIGAVVDPELHRKARQRRLDFKMPSDFDPSISPRMRARFQALADRFTARH